MKKLMLVSMLLMTIVIGGIPAQASPIEGDDLGVGVMLGSVASVTGKQWNGTTQAIDFGVGNNYNDQSWVFGDYLWHFPQVVERTPGIMPYVGAGLGMGFNRILSDQRRNVDVFGRAPLGIAWYPADIALGIFGEVVPSVAVAPVLAGYLDAGVGARYYF